MKTKPVRTMTNVLVAFKTRNFWCNLKLKPGNATFWLIKTSFTVSFKFHYGHQNLMYFKTTLSSLWMKRLHSLTLLGLKATHCQAIKLASIADIYTTNNLIIAHAKCRVNHCSPRVWRNAPQRYRVLEHHNFCLCKLRWPGHHMENPRCHEKVCTCIWKLHIWEHSQGCCPCWRAPARVTASFCHAQGGAIKKCDFW